MPIRYRVEITAAAQDDVASIWNFISVDDPRAANRFMDELLQQVETLSAFPMRCPVIPESRELGVEYRHLIYGDYRTIFRVSGRHVLIVRIVHGSRLLEL